MKQIDISINNKLYRALLTIDGYGVCDISIYRKRSTKKWYQSWWEDFYDFVYVPETMADLRYTIQEAIIGQELENKKKEKFMSEYLQLKEVPLI